MTTTNEYDLAESGQASVTGNLYVPQTPEPFHYDADGNLTADGRWNYTWDAENRLIRMAANTAAGPQISLAFQYDWRSRRIHKQVWPNTTWNNSPTNDTSFVYDGWNPVAELNTLSTPALTRAYMWGLDLSGSERGAGGVGGLLELSDAANGVHFPAFDGNGNVAGLAAAASGVTSGAYEYGPFGEVTRATGPVARCNPARFSTKSQDDEADLLYYGYRYYNDSTGRWLSRDPLEDLTRAPSQGRITSHIATSLYAFVANDALMAIDPSGLKIWVCTVHANPPFPAWSTHSYLWDDRPNTPPGKRECGKESCCGKNSRGFSSGNTGPPSGDTHDPWQGTGPKGNTECYPVDDSDGHETAIMSCCDPKSKGYHMNDGLFFPFTDDCHTAIDKCLQSHGFNSPPHSRGDLLSNRMKDIECACRD